MQNRLLEKNRPLTSSGFPKNNSDLVDLSFWLLILPLFYAATAVATRVGLDSRLLTGPIRIAIACLGTYALWVILTRSIKPSIPIIIFYSVSIAYLIKIIIEEASGRLSMFQNGSSVIAQFLITTLIPSFYLYLRPFPSVFVLKKIWGALLCLCILLYYSYRDVTISPEGLRAAGVMEMLGIINPIVVGHMGALLVELSIYLFLFTKDRLKFLYLTGCLGLTLVIISNSRGPVLALVLVITLIIATRFRQVITNGVRLAGLITLIALFGTLVFYTLEKKENVLVDRFIYDEDGGSGRAYLYSECIQAAWRSPFFGESIFISMPDGTQSGSESFLLDPFLANGLLAGITWLALAIYAIITSIRIFFRVPQFWIIMLFLHGLVLFGLSAGLISAGWGFATFLGVLRIKQLSGSPYKG